MAKKIATAEAVFKVCEELDAAGQPWNRDDVRYQVGGGGFNVIDPLIQAWRRLKPVKAIAPNTPTELLHQIANSLEQHFTTYLAQIDENAKAREKAFDQATVDLSGEIESLNEHIAQLTHAQEHSQAKITALSEQKAQVLEEHNILKAQYKNLQVENDTLTGQVSRLEQQAETKALDFEQRYNALRERHQTDIKDIEQNHKQTLDQQQRSWRESQEAAENRLMRMIDKERNEHKSRAAAVMNDMQVLKNQVHNQQEQLLILHKKLSKKDEKISSLQEERKALLNDDKKNDALAEIQAAIKGLQNQMLTDTHS